MEDFLSQIPTIIRCLVPFIPVIVAIINKIPTSKTDPVENKLKTFHNKYDGKTIAEIAAMGRSEKGE